MYDIFYVSKQLGNDSDWLALKSKYPFAQRISNLKSYDEIKSKSFTKMFWVIWDDVILNDSFNLVEYKSTKWDEMYVHIFKNGDEFDGICLFPKSLSISQREFHHRFFIEKKEIDVNASIPKQYNKYDSISYDEYLKIDDEMFWVTFPDVIINDNSIFNMYFSHHNSYDRRENHVFKNICNNEEIYLTGVMLCSKYKKLSKREFERQYAVDKKEHDILVGKYQYPIYNITTYDEYVNIANSEKSKMFWCVWPNIEVTDPAVFDLYFDPHTAILDYDRGENHVFKNLFNDKETYVNGIVLFSTSKLISHKEFNHKFLIEKKEHDLLTSKHRLYDVVFISYNEVNADENYNKLVIKCPRAKRIHGVKGIHQAHIKAAELCNTEMIWVVDGDAVIEDEFDFNLVMSSYDIDCVHVWRSKNPINDLEYGNGGVKLLPRELTLSMNVDSLDMTTSISNKFKAMEKVSNVTAFNVDAFASWRSAFRECCKLSSRVIERQYEEETQQRLDIWCTVGADKPYGEYALRGAKEGRAYGLEHKNNSAVLVNINNFEWLQEKFNASK